MLTHLLTILIVCQCGICGFIVGLLICGSYDLSSRDLPKGPSAYKVPLLMWFVAGLSVGSLLVVKGLHLIVLNY